MKKFLSTTTLILVFLNGFSQEKNEIQSFKRNELKINAAFLVAGIAELTYERLINEESGAGISIFAALDEEISTKFSLAPYYRFYFGKKPAAGFFVEGFTMLNVIDIDEAYYFNSLDPMLNGYYKSDSYTDFAIGIGLGSKWITKKGVLFEINGGFGRNLINTDKNDYFDHTFVGRGGITIGYQF